MKVIKDAFDPTVFNMAVLRFVSAFIELSAAITMLVLNDVRKAVVVNSMLAIVGPLIFIVTMTIGLIGLAGEVSYGRLLLIGIGVLLVMIGILR